LDDGRSEKVAGDKLRLIGAREGDHYKAAANGQGKKLQQRRSQRQKI
jgi:hypothetical protein